MPSLLLGEVTTAMVLNNGDLFLLLLVFPSPTHFHSAVSLTLVVSLWPWRCFSPIINTVIIFCEFWENEHQTTWNLSTLNRACFWKATLLGWERERWLEGLKHKALAEDWSSVPSIHREFTTACKSGSGGSDDPSFQGRLHSRARPHPDTKVRVKSFEQTKDPCSSESKTANTFLVLSLTLQDEISADLPGTEVS